MENYILSTEKMSERDAKEICSWRYEPPYDIYNYPGWESAKAHGWEISVEEKREKQFFSVKSGGVLIGWFRLSEE